MKNKNKLMKNKVESDAFHVGIELELVAPCEDSEHDDDACLESYRENIESESTSSILRNYIGLASGLVDSIEPYFDRDTWINHYVDGWQCDDSDCPYHRGNGHDVREKLEDDLIKLTSNTSFKVVEDGSIETPDGTTDAEVCWNYYASPSCIKDNKNILKFLEKNNCKFNKTCGLHINLNNYLNVPQEEIETEYFDFLFNYVAVSRRDSTYCNRLGISAYQKYSMIYHQGDRLEFRFFSPTLDADKLNAYVSLAHFIYKRLAGKKVTMSKKLQDYFIDKMMNVNKLTKEQALNTIEKTNNIKKISVRKQEVA